VTWGRLLAAGAAASFCGTLAFVRAQGAAAAGAAVDPALFAGMHWRSIGPYRGGRAVAVAGAGDGRTYYFGAVGGGVWKTANAGTTWTNLTDALPVSSIGALAVAPSDPQTIYAGSGEADMRSDIIAGNGLYASRDGGASWSFRGLADSRQIGRVLVAPSDPGTLLVAALGHAYGPNDMRGVFRSNDGGATWSRTLFRDADTGAIDLAADPAWHVVFASLWQTRRPPWNTYPPSNGPGSGLYRSLDAGRTWVPVRGGFPSEGLGKIGLAVAPGDPQRVYAIVDAKAGGLYRSDDGGLNWKLIDGDRRLWQRGWYFCHVAVDPKNPDLVYVSDTAFYRSRDGGAHFEAIKGSPDGDDTHQLWIDPLAPERMVLGSDQGASVSLDGAATWSTWFNQPTGQFYHVATDDAFPFRIYGAQQDSGAAMIPSRSSHERIEERDWLPLTAGGEAGYLAPDPHDRNLVFGGTVEREDLRTRQTRRVSPTAGLPGAWRGEWTLPLVFGPDGALYFGNQFVWRTRDGGAHWERISPALTRPRAPVPDTLDAATAADAADPQPRGVVYALAPSPRDARTIWAGSDDGLVHLSLDAGRSWRDVTPAGLGSWSHVTGIEASHFDTRTAYVAVDRHRLDDERPYLYITHDAGRTWSESHAGIPADSFVNAVREDPARRGLLYAGTETGVSVSFDDGAAWQSLRLDMPVVSVRDLAIRDGDLAIATHGRAFWILDDLEPLRQLALDPAAGARLFAPRTAIRTRPGDDEAEASPPETPAGENPPNGAYLDYVVPNGAGSVRLEVLDAAGVSLRRWSSDDRAVAIDPASVDYPPLWIEAPERLDPAPGMHRFVWNFHALARDGPLAPPGRYRIRLSLAGRTLERPLELRRDPRIAASAADLRAQYELARGLGAALARARAALAQPGATPALRRTAGLLRELLAQVESADSRPSLDEVRRWNALRQALGARTSFR
jgi:photosystem II stability/assembly factor-like uncharacterized protein